jgi:hypothetical protein
MRGPRLHLTKRPIPPSTRALVDHLAQGDPAEVLTFGDLLDEFSERGFGLFLLLAMLPNFIPAPGVGALSGALVILIGVQLLFHFKHPWLPRFLARRTIQRSTLVHFRERVDKWLRRIEKLIRPRNPFFLENPVAHAFSGLLLILLGIVLALPLPLTNYLFGALVLGYSLALIERDGRLMWICWLLGVAEVAIVAGFSGQMIAWGAQVTDWVRGLF